MRQEGVAHLDDDVGPVGGSDGVGALLGDEDDAAVLLVLAGVLLALVEDAVVVRLRDANELAVVALGPHHAAVVQFVHRRCYPEAVPNPKHTHT